MHKPSIFSWFLHISFSLFPSLAFSLFSTYSTSISLMPRHCLSCELFPSLSLSLAIDRLKRFIAIRCLNLLQCTGYHEVGRRHAMKRRAKKYGGRDENKAEKIVLMNAIDMCYIFISYSYWLCAIRLTDLSLISQQQQQHHQQATQKVVWWRTNTHSQQTCVLKHSKGKGIEFGHESGPVSVKKM